jgi:DNA-directed RNA polymerase subunit N (RpoN/RPB10)
MRGLLRLAEDYVEANQGGWCRDGVGSGIVLKQIRAALAGAAGRPHWSSDDPSVTITPQGEMSVDPECLTCGRSTKRHPGYVIGNHWLESAYERICAGEAEDDVLADYGVARALGVIRWLDYWRTTMPTAAADELAGIIRTHGAADQPSASLTAQGDMGAAFGPADGSGKWYDTDPACQRKCGLCGQSVIKHIVPGEAHRHWAGSLGLICPTDPRLVTASPTSGGA